MGVLRNDTAALGILCTVLKKSFWRPSWKVHAGFSLHWTEPCVCPVAVRFSNELKNKEQSSDVGIWLNARTVAQISTQLNAEFSTLEHDASAENDQ